jgi:hypothetical protein
MAAVDPVEVARRLNAYEAHGRNQRAAALALGLSRGALQDTLKAAGVIGGPEPTAGYEITGMSSTYDGEENLRSTSIRERPERGMVRDALPGFAIASRTVHRVGGEAMQTWDREKPEAAAQHAAMLVAFDAMAADLPRLEPVAAPKATNAKLLNLYTLTDCHVGMLAWHREGGVDWDLAIAERTLFGCFAAMIERSPPAASCIVNQLGDFLHYDGLSAITPTSGHVLDADGRFQKMVEVAVRLLRRIVDLALTKHETVHVIMAEGNHDLASSVWLRVMFKALYENEPRVTVDDSALPYYAYEFGAVMLAFAHGHLKKPVGLPMLFAAQFSEMWGRTKKRFGHSGHEHHEQSDERDGMEWRKHPTMAARDAYAARFGWHAHQAATSHTYHFDFGKWGTQTVYPEMLELEAAA